MQQVMSDFEFKTQTNYLQLKSHVYDLVGEYDVQYLFPVMRQIRQKEKTIKKTAVVLIVLGLLLLIAGIGIVLIFAGFACLYMGYKIRKNTRAVEALIMKDPVWKKPLRKSPNVPQQDIAEVLNSPDFK